MSQPITLSRNTNQALGIGQYAIDFMSGAFGSGPDPAVLERTRLFHTDSVLCGVSALALETNAPTLLRNEALGYREDDPEQGAFVFGSNQCVVAEKAIVANCSAVREWDSNGTNFGYRPELGHRAGEFGHNDYYPVVIAACQQRGLDGETALRAMVLLDEIRGRLAEVFSLKTYKIDHVVHGAIASAAVYGALMGATAEEIEHAIGMFVAHHIPWRAIRAGKQLSDSKGASAAISTEAAVLCMKRAMAGFVGPKDIFRNPESMFRQFVRTDGDSPFDLVLSTSGSDFAVMGMHFKLGLYEHQSAGALQGVIDLAYRHKWLLEKGAIEKITILAYEPAFGIIGDPAKKDPRTRQSADHSMVFIVSRMIVRARRIAGEIGSFANTDEVWKACMLDPQDYHSSAIFDEETRELMAKIEFAHGGPSYDDKYPDGIPTSVVILASDGKEYNSDLVMYPAGHARNETADLRSILAHKFNLMGRIALPDDGDVQGLVDRLESIDSLDSYGMASLYDFDLASRPGYED
ncbi:MAG: MmgE/PrpD family protein [Fimbriimonadaceae bacterium]|jgi:2-methylcitrate dehydratase|nr:MmgE/PrpD family protein [Fimbriimonadaceae bacterium]